MAYGDVKINRTRGGGGGGYSFYDDEGRGRSKRLYERFEEEFLSISAEHRAASILEESSPNWYGGNLTDYSLAEIASGTTYRYDLHDFVNTIHWLSDSKLPDTGDGRIKRLITKHCGAEVWEQFLDRAYDAQFKAGIADSIRRKRRQREWDEEQAQHEAREAVRLTKVEEETDQMVNRIMEAAGDIRSDIFEATRQKEAHDQDQGDWLDNPVEAYRSGYGWGEERKEASGVKIQVTLSLDLSNSMKYNKIAEAAHAAFLEMGLSLKTLDGQFGDSFKAAFFVFSGGRSGKYVRRLKKPNWGGKDWDKGWHLQEFEEWRTYSSWNFDGEDTWISPLFQEIQTWERKEGIPDAARLDLIISDAVLEHPRDLSKADMIQEERNGTVQSVILNLMPDDENLHDGRLPRRTYQYLVNPEYLIGAIRRVMTEFLAVHI